MLQGGTTLCKTTVGEALFSLFNLGFGNQSAFEHQPDIISNVDKAQRAPRTFGDTASTSYAICIVELAVFLDERFDGDSLITCGFTDIARNTLSHVRRDLVKAQLVDDPKGGSPRTEEPTEISIPGPGDHQEGGKVDRLIDRPEKKDVSSGDGRLRHCQE